MFSSEDAGSSSPVRTVLNKLRIAMGRSVGAQFNGSARSRARKL